MPGEERFGWIDLAAHAASWLAVGAILVVVVLVRA